MTKVGATLGPYELLAELGKGGMANLFLAQRVGPGGFSRQVAIKVVNVEHASDPHFVKMFLDEARLAARVQHPNVVHVEELGEQEGVHYLVMEYVDGVTLSDVLRGLGQRGAALPIEIAVNIAAQVADGLHGAHEATDAAGRPLGLVHRDVSPSNVLLSARGLVKVIDFGIARAQGRLTSTEQGALKGKLAYMTPEQLVGEAVDRRSDVFALGIVLWEMLTMRRLFFGSHQAKMMQRIRAAEVEPPSKHREGLSGTLDQVVLAALARSRDERFQTAQAFRRALLTACPQAMLIEPAAIAELVRNAAREALEHRRSAAALDDDRTIVAPPPLIPDVAIDDAEIESFLATDVPSEEIPALERQMEEARASGDAKVEVRVTARLVGVLIYAGQLERAEELLRHVDQLVAEKATDMKGFLASLRGQFAAAQGDLAARLRSQLAAMEAYERAGWARRAARAAVNVADTYNHFGAYEAAEKALHDALARAKELDLPDTEAYAHVNLGHSLTMQDRFAEADAHLSAALEIATERSDHRLAMFACLYRADLLCRAGRWTAARAEAERIAEMAREREQPATEAIALTHVARAALASGDRDTALSASERAYEIYKALGSMEESEGLLYVTRVRALEAAGRADEAKRVHDEGLRRLDEIAMRIADPAWRLRFLRHVHSHAELLGSTDR